MPTKVKELDNLKEGNADNCPICNPSTKRIREDRVWTFAQVHPGVSPWR